jgi:hypothetical protein
MNNGLIILGVLIVLLSASYVSMQFGLFSSEDTSTTITPSNYTSSTSVPTVTSASTQLPTFNLSGSRVIVSGSYAYLAFNYTTTSPVVVYLYNNVTTSANVDLDNFYNSYGSWSFAFHALLNDTSGASKLTMAGPVPGKYLMVAYSVDSYGDPVTAVWNRTFTFSGAHMVIRNASVLWTTNGGSGVYWYEPTLLTAYVENTGDLPSYGYYLRGWVNDTAIFSNTGPYYGWIPVGGPLPLNITYAYGVFQSSGNYPLHVELVKDSRLAAEWNGNTRIS